MEPISNNFIEVHYELLVPNESGNMDLVEKTAKDHPFDFISGMGFTLDSFEQQIIALKDGDSFDFTIPVDAAYGEFMDEHVIELQKDIFNINGKFDESRIYPGNVIPLKNEDGNRFDGIVKEVRESVVVVDFNHPLAGKPLHFKGSIVTNRPATTKEMETFINRINGDEHECSCGHDHQCGEHHDGECCGGHGEGKCEGHHHHDGECCGKHGGNCCHHQEEENIG